MTSSKQGIRRGAAVAIAIVGVIHLVLSPEYLDEQAYIGVLFIAGGLAALFVAVRLWLGPDTFAWSLGALVAAGMFAGFVLSRTTGLPGFKESEWELSGIVSLLLEAGFIGAFIAALRERPAAARSRRSSPVRARTEMQT
jgi:hypothetical protein